MADDFSQLIDHYFREEYGKVVSFLTAKFGSRHLELAEDAVQEALIKAMQTWPHGQIPSNPSGWIMRVASNKMIDSLRKLSPLDISDTIPEKEKQVMNIELDSIKDDLVKMMFACCHPSLSTEYQIILVLKILGGLSVKEIARALLKKEETIAKSYTRAKKKFKEEEIQLELPSTAEIKSRLDTVLKVIYLLFNEGYKTTIGDLLIRKDLCGEAIRLNSILLENKNCNTSSSNSLMALMCFHSARFDTRMDENGELITLEFQDRLRWDRDFISSGMNYLQDATQGVFLNEFYIQAMISGIHCQAQSYEKTNWTEILDMYDLLLKKNPSPTVQLNRIIVLSQVHSSSMALQELKTLGQDVRVRNHYLYHAVLGELYLLEGMPEKAKEANLMAASMTHNEVERRHLVNKSNSMG